VKKKKAKGGSNVHPPGMGVRKEKRGEREASFSRTAKVRRERRLYPIDLDKRKVTKEKEGHGKRKRRYQRESGDPKEKGEGEYPPRGTRKEKKSPIGGGRERGKYRNTPHRGRILKERRNVLWARKDKSVL